MTRSNERPDAIAIPLDDISLPIDHPRRVVDEGAIERLTASLSDFGLLMPIAVTPANVLIFGSRRLAAARKLGWSHIEARIFDSADDPELRRLMAWEENDARQRLSLEEQLAFKREVLDPMLKSRARARRRANASALSHRRRSAPDEVGNLPTSTDAASVHTAPAATGEQSARVTCDRSGSAREIIGHYLQMSPRTMEKFEQIARWSEDESLPEPLRDEATRARERANALGKVDGEYKRVRTLVDGQNVSPRDPAVETEHALTKAFTSLEKLIGEHPAQQIGPDLPTGVWRGIATALQLALEWGREVKAVRDEHPA